MRRRRMVPYIFFLPYALLFILFMICPIAYSVYLSLFTSKAGINKYVGTRNYEKAFKDTAFWSGFGNVALYGVIVIVVMISLSLVLALILDSNKIKGKGLFRLLFFLPYAVPGIIAAIMWGFLYSPDFNVIWKWLSVTPYNALMFCLVNITVWLWTGYNMTIIYANLTTISLDIYEAAKLDGCNEFQTAIYMKIPLIKSTIFMTIALTIIGALQLFNEPYMLTDLTAISSTYTPNMYIYNMAFSYGNFPYSATLSIILAVITILISSIFKFVTRERKLR